MPISVAIVEDNRQVREMLAQIVAKAADLRCLGAYGSAEEALAPILATPPDVVLMDIDLPGMSGVECVCRLSEALRDVQILMLTVYKDIGSIFDALSAGAVGYLTKPVRAAELLAAIREVQKGGAPMNGLIARKVIEVFRRQPLHCPRETEDLSPRELEVLDLLARGHQYKEIALKLDISYTTIRTHVQHINRKLHVRCRAEAIARYLGRPLT